MIEFFWERMRRILLVRYAAAVTVDNLDRLDDRLKAFFAREGLMDTIVDFTAVPGENIEMDMVVERAKRPSRDADSPTRRIFVVDGPLQYGLMRTYSAYQEFRGYKPPDLVTTVDAALELLDAPEAKFEPV